MMRSLALSLLVVGVFATTSAAQSPGAASGPYNATAEGVYGGIVTSVISVAGPDGTVGVHLNLKTATGVNVKVHLGPAVFIGMNNFSFFADDLILVKGAYVTHDGEVGLWAREVFKGGKALALRGPDGTPRWTSATADDPDGCGVSHTPVRH
jgi:hypothetical protein